MNAKSLTGRARRLALSIGGLAVAGVVLAGCAGAAGGDGDGGAESEKTLITIGHGGAVDSLQNKAALEIKDRVEELTDGAVTVEVYPSSQLGSWEEMQESLELGSQDVLIESLGSLERYTDLAAAASIPFQYETADEFFEIWEGELGQEIVDRVAEESGFRLVGSLYRGPFILATKSEVESPDDLAGIKLRVPNQASVIETWRTLGSSPTPMALNEVFTALEQGAIDGVENPIDIHRYNSFYEIAPFIAETNHLYGNYYLQVWEDAYDAWPADVREAFDQAVGEVSESYRDRSIEDAAESKSVMEEGGATFTDVDFDEWRDTVEPVYATLPESVQEWRERVNEALGR